MGIESTGAGIPNNYNKPVAGTSATTPQQPGPQTANTPVEPQENTEFNNISEYKGQEIKNSKFDPDEAAKKHNINFAPKEEKEFTPNIIATLAGALIGIIGGSAEVLEPVKKDLDKINEKTGRLGTNMKMNPFGGGISEKESAEERFSKMSKQPSNTNNIPEK